MANSYRLISETVYWEPEASTGGASKLGGNGRSGKVVQEAVSETTMLSLVSADMGATFIAESARGRKPENVTPLQVQDFNATITLKAIWRTGDKNPALKEFLNLVRRR